MGWATHTHGWLTPVDKQIDDFKSLEIFLYLLFLTSCQRGLGLAAKAVGRPGVKEVDLSDESALLRSAEDQLPLGG